MRFSDAFLRQVRDRVSIADYAGRRLSWHKQKSRPSAGDYWACCPFHQEKSPSFHVLDQKGIFNCFGCGEKGDVFTLAMKLEGLSFPEAVSQMAERAGMETPKDDYEDRGDNDRRKRLYQITTRTAKLYADALANAGRGFEAAASFAEAAERAAQADRAPTLRRRGSVADRLPGASGVESPGSDASPSCFEGGVGPSGDLRSDRTAAHPERD